MKEQQIYDILRHHKIPLKKRELIINDLKAVIESNQKEFVEWVRLNKSECVYGVNASIDVDKLLTKFKELNQIEE